MLRPCELCRTFFEIPEGTVYDFESYCDILRIDGRAHVFITGRGQEKLAEAIIAEQNRVPKTKQLRGFDSGDELAALLAPTPQNEAATLDALFPAEPEAA
jgi:hypothetical protein